MALTKLQTAAAVFMTLAGIGIMVGTLYGATTLNDEIHSKIIDSVVLNDSGDFTDHWVNAHKTEYNFYFYEYTNMEQFLDRDQLSLESTIHGPFAFNEDLSVSTSITSSIATVTESRTLSTARSSDEYFRFTGMYNGYVLHTVELQKAKYEAGSSLQTTFFMSQFETLAPGCTADSNVEDCWQAVESQFGSAAILSDGMAFHSGYTGVYNDYAGWLTHIKNPQGGVNLPTDLLTDVQANAVLRGSSGFLTGDVKDFMSALTDASVWGVTETQLIFLNEYFSQHLNILFRDQVNLRLQTVTDSILGNRDVDAIVDETRPYAIRRPLRSWVGAFADPLFDEQLIDESNSAYYQSHTGVQYTMRTGASKKELTGTFYDISSPSMEDVGSTDCSSESLRSRHKIGNGKQFAPGKKTRFDIEPRIGSSVTSFHQDTSQRVSYDFDDDVLAKELFGKRYISELPTDASGLLDLTCELQFPIIASRPGLVEASLEAYNIPLVSNPELVANISNEWTVTIERFTGEAITAYDSLQLNLRVQFPFSTTPYLIPIMVAERVSSFAWLFIYWLFVFVVVVFRLCFFLVPCVSFVVVRLSTSLHVNPCPLTTPIFPPVYARNSSTEREYEPRPCQHSS